MSEVELIGGPRTSTTFSSNCLDVTFPFPGTVRRSSISISDLTLAIVATLCRLEEVDAKARNKAIFGFLNDSEASKSRLWPLLESKAFIPTTAGNLKRAVEVYDPKNRRLHHLFGDAADFPTSDVLAQPEVDGWQAVS